jgi:Ala-tRNA(Pro) deacylase
MKITLYEKIRSYLDETLTPRREIHHEATRTSKESAEARGDSMRLGGKALVIKIGDAFHLMVLSAERSLDSARVKEHFGVKKFRFATTEELVALDLVPGAVPPLGEPILPIALHVDPSVLANSVIAFNAGSLTESIILGIDDYIRLSRPHVFRFAKDIESN